MRTQRLLLPILLFLIAASNLCAREWTDATGKYKVKAELVDVKDGIVRLAREDGKIIATPLNRLSAADQAYVQKMEAGDQGTRSVAWSGEPRLTLAGHTNAVKAVAFSRDGKTVATGGWDGTVKLWDATTGQERTVLQAFKLGVNCVAFSPDGATLAAGGWKDATVMRWNVATGAEADFLPPDKGSYGINAVAFSPDGETLAAACSDTTAKLWNLRTGKLLGTFIGHRHFVLSVAFSPDGKMAATGSFYGPTIKLWDVRNTKEVATLKNKGGPIASVAFSPDGRTLATGSWDRIAELWDCETRKVRTVCRGHTGCIQSLSFSPDGRLLATGSIEGPSDNKAPLRKGGKSQAEVKLWDPQTGRELADLPVRLTMVEAVAFSPDGRVLATAGIDTHAKPAGTVRLWDVSQVKSQ